MDSAKLKKLQDYSVHLTQQAEAKENRGEPDEAVKDYVKLVDVLLLLANEAKDHPAWQGLIGRAEFYQKKARAMAGAGETERPPALKTVSDVSLETKTVPKPSQSSNENTVSIDNGSPNSRFKTFRKFSSFIGITPENAISASNEIGQKSSEPAAPPRPPTPMLMLPSISPSSAVQVIAQQHQIEPREETVSRETHAKVLEERARLQREVEVLKERLKSFHEAIEVRDRQLSEVVSTTVPKTEYEVAVSKLRESVPRAEYEQALAVATIPKERYIELQSQITDLELRLQNSVPRIVVDEIAEYVTFLVSMVLSSGEEKKPEAALAKLPESA